MIGLVGYLVLFGGIGVFFLFFHLLLGRFFRPVKPDPDKLTIYECGEPTIGSAWIQFDLRFYVVALLFVIFDVEVAFFFPWAVVFGKANTLANSDLTRERRLGENYALVPEYRRLQARKEYLQNHPEIPGGAEDIRDINQQLNDLEKLAGDARQNAQVAHQVAWFAFWDILVFFGVLLVGFAYLWKRGDLDWVRSTAAERTAAAEVKGPTPEQEAGLLVGAGRNT